MRKKLITMAVKLASTSDSKISLSSEANFVKARMYAFSDEELCVGIDLSVTDAEQLVLSVGKCSFLMGTVVGRGVSLPCDSASKPRAVGGGSDMFPSTFTRTYT